jgi:hypothetical protein
MAEPLPTKSIITEFNGQWNAGNVTKPSLIEATGTGFDSTADPIRFDLNKGDVLVSRAGSPALEETPIGNWNYANKSYNVEVEVFTRTDRQRLYDLMQEIRRICHDRMHDITSFQRVQFKGFVEQTQQQANLWTGIVNIQLVNQATLMET